jgi:hypothetical protein
MQALRQELARRGYRLTEVRILDLLIWSVEATARPARRSIRTPRAGRTLQPS